MYMSRMRRIRRIAARSLPIATKDQVRQIAQRESLRWAEAYEGLLAAVEGRPTVAMQARLPKASQADRVRKSVAKLKVQASSGQKTPGAEDLVRSLRRGASIEEAVLDATREMLKAKRQAMPQSMADGLRRNENTRVAGDLAAGVIAHHRRYYRLARQYFNEVPAPQCYKYAPVEAIDSLFWADRAEGVKRARKWLDDVPDFDARTWFEIYRHLFVADELKLADVAFARVKAVYEDPAQQAKWAAGADEIAWGERWAGSERDRTSSAPEGARVSFGVVDYPQPGRARASQNIGDQIQTLASLGHVVRHQNLRFHGEPDVVAFVTAMQERVRPELRREKVSADVELVTVDRDSSTYQSFAPDTWLLEFGWHMHALFRLDTYDFPLHPNLNPIFVSFHCNKRELLTPDAIDYLRAHGPIGCRDWTTVDLLLSLDVPAFFSGCLTTTVNTVFPDLERKPEPATAYVDVSRTPVPKGHENIKQSYGAIKKRSFTENMWDAVNLLERYRRNYTNVVTTRLHCYLPTTSIGLKAAFEPKNNADVRFAGLFRLSEQEFDDMRARMRDRLEPVLTAIFEGKDRESVYDVWSRTVAPEVEIARARHEDVDALPSAEPLVRKLVDSVATVDRSEDESVCDVVLTPTTKEIAHLAKVLGTASRSTSRPLRAWIVSPESMPEQLEVDGVTIEWVDTSAMDFAASGVLDRRSLDRALISELVPVDRAVLLPVDAAVAGDLTELYELDLGDSRLAARSTSKADDSGFGVLYGAARRLDATPEVAYEFYRRIHRAHEFDFEAFDTDVLVLDLKGLREDHYAARVLPAMKLYRLDDRDALHYLNGPKRAELDAVWASVPTRERAADPKIWHWADTTKPWSSDVVPGDGAALWESA